MSEALHFALYSSSDVTIESQNEKGATLLTPGEWELTLIVENIILNGNIQQISCSDSFYTHMLLFTGC